MQKENTLSVFKTAPQDFSTSLEVTACYVQFKDKFLFLKNAERKVQKGKWGVPGGKIEKGEQVIEAAIREAFEETSICLDKNKIKYLGKVFVRKNIDFVFHMLYQELETMPSISLSDEHDMYQWIALKDIPLIDVMSGGLEILEHFKEFVDA
jgi:8-oxo-dGTP pyrophosphatase MutT (NUDIX family)